MFSSALKRSGISYGLVLSAGVLVALLLLGLFAPLPHDPLKPDASSVLQPPSMQHWFGTDSAGLDVFARTIDAARRDLPLAFVGAIASAFLGVVLGLLATSPGRISSAVMRLLDAFQAFPLIILAIAIITLTGNRLEMVIFAILLIEVPRFTRLVRSEGLTIRELRFVEAAESMGASQRRILFRHILPNVAGVVVAQLSISAANALMVIAAASFLRIGVSPPNPSWGSMIQAGAREITLGLWWISLFPGLAIFVSVISLNVLADALDDLLQRSGH